MIAVMTVSYTHLTLPTREGRRGDLGCRRFITKKKTTHKEQSNHKKKKKEKKKDKNKKKRRKK